MIIYRLLVIVILNQVLFGQTYNPSIEEIVDLVSLDSLVKHVRILSGEDSVSLGDSTFLITSRISNVSSHESEGHRVAAKYLVRTLEQYLPEVSEQTFIWRDIDTIRNIIGIQEGFVNPEDKIIISGHYDSYASGEDAPGADDNASGTATVLEAARILSNYQFDRTILYILWDWEEEGAVGSGYFCTDYEDIANIDVILNFDMIAYDVLDTGLVEIFDNGDSLEYNFSSIVENVISLYDLNLTPIFNEGGSGLDSDPFLAYEICPSMSITEAFFGLWEYHNPYYHSEDDKIEHFNLNYYERVAKLAIASSAEIGFAGTSSIHDNYHNTKVDNFLLIHNYPNPFNPSTTIEYDLPEYSEVSLVIYDVAGREVTTLISAPQLPGSYNVSWDGADLKGLQVAGGMYFARLQAGDYSSVVKMVYLR